MLSMFDTSKILQALSCCMKITHEQFQRLSRPSNIVHVEKLTFFKLNQEIFEFCAWIAEANGGEQRREAKRRSTKRASFYSHMGKQNSIITREILILAMCFIEQKVILFRCEIDIRDESARTLSDSLFLKYIKRYLFETFT